MPCLQSALAIPGATVTRLEEYQEYHRRVVEECVELMGEDSREFYEKQCTYFDEWEQGVHPRQVAQEQLDAMRDLVTEADERNSHIPEKRARDSAREKAPARDTRLDIEKPRRRFRAI